MYSLSGKELPFKVLGGVPVSLRVVSAAAAVGADADVIFCTRRRARIPTQQNTLLFCANRMHTKYCVFWIEQGCITSTPDSSQSRTPLYYARPVVFRALCPQYVETTVYPHRYMWA